jgi:hypothetical protein
MLSGGHRNSLGRTREVVEIVLGDRARLGELFDCVMDADELVRMRAGDALEKVCRERPVWFLPYVERLLGEVGGIAQPSVMWHVAQMLAQLHGRLSDAQARRAAELLKRNLVGSGDCIVLNVTMDVLADWAQSDTDLAVWEASLSVCGWIRIGPSPSAPPSALSS